jgi:hypothetical protein
VGRRIEKQMISDRNIDNNAQIQSHKILGAGPMRKNAKVYYVDGTNGSDNNSGRTPIRSFKTIQAAVTAADGFDTIYVFPKAMAAGSTDPGSYAETIIIPATHECLSLIGVGHRTQGGLPQIKIGAGTTALLTVRAPGCYIAGLGFNGVSSTGGGILLDDDASTKTAFGTTIENCHFKNCVGTTATNAATGGAIIFAASAEGCPWQLRIRGNRFYKNVGDIVSLVTAGLQPQDVIIENNIFSGPAANVDCNLYLKGAGTTGIIGLVIDNNIFPEKPAIGSGTNAIYIDATGCGGVMTRNFFGCNSAEGLSEVTFEAAGTAAKIPTTLFMAGNYGQFATGVGNGLISGEIFA